jgi:large subunit ribosomal protein L6
MSRIGKQPVAIPKGVTVTVQDRTVRAVGPKGELSLSVDEGVAVTIADGSVTVQRERDGKHHQALHGLFRALINNMVTGVAQSFHKTLEIEGVGYTARLDGPRRLALSIGFNAPVVLAIPDGLTVETPKPTVITIRGIDLQKVGQFAAEVRGVRPPEPYKGKGIRYQGEHIIRKAGKAVGGKSA